MSATTLPNLRVNSNWYAVVKLYDNSVAIDWSTLTIQNVFMVAESQDYAFAGGLSYSIDTSDATKLHVIWPAASQLYEGIHRIVVQVTLQNDDHTYDKRAVNVVATTDSSATATDTETAVDITVSEVNTSVMTAILRACQQATVAANAAAGHGPYIGTNGHWFVWNNTTSAYVDSNVTAAGTAGADGTTPHIGDNGHWYIGTTDTGVSAQGATGATGASGNINYPTMEVDASMHLVATALTSGDADRFNIDDSGHLQLTI